MASSNVVHVQTVFNTVLGIRDEDGNVVNKQPINVEADRLTPEDFSQVAEAIIKSKEELASKMSGPNKLVHVQTVARTVLGVVDDEGNIVNKQPISVEVPRLSGADFASAAAAIRRGMAEMASKIDTAVGE